MIIIIWSWPLNQILSVSTSVKHNNLNFLGIWINEAQHQVQFQTLCFLCGVLYFWIGKGIWSFFRGAKTLKWYLYWTLYWYCRLVLIDTCSYGTSGSHLKTCCTLTDFTRVVCNYSFRISSRCVQENMCDEFDFWSFIISQSCQGLGVCLGFQV